MSTCMFVIFIISSLPIPSFGTLTFDPKPTPLSPCVEDRDPNYDGVRVNCQNKGISSLPLPAHWIPMETSSLLLDYNSLVSLNQSSFSTFPTWRRLRLLGLSHNSISQIEKSTFSKFVSLRQLYLDNNFIKLDRNSFSGREFDGLVNLSELTLGNNKNEANEGNYSASLLSHLHNLRSLTLDTFLGDLNFGNIFHASKLLTTLTFTGGMTNIKNESLESFSFIDLTELTITGCANLQHTETGAFRHLMRIQTYSLFYIGQGLRDTLESLAPFVSKNISHITFTGLYYDKTTLQTFSYGSFLTADMARYLSQICVENLALTASGIFIVEANIFTSTVWMKCLRTLDLSDNPILGERGMIFHLHSMHRLEIFKIMNVKYSFLNSKGRVVWKPPSCPCRTKSSTFGTQKTSEGIGTQRSGHMDNKESQPQNESNTINKTAVTVSLDSSASTPTPRYFIRFKTHEQSTRHVQPLFGLGSFTFPKRLKILILNSFGDYFFRLDEHVYVKNGGEIEEIHLSDNGGRKFIGCYIGLTNLKLLDVSRNFASLMSPTFFNTVSSIVHLNMAEMNLDDIFIKEYSSELFSPLTQLSTLDLSRNDLRGLSKNTFRANNKLQVLLLTGNRFESVPFDLSHVPHLCWLDLRGNALRELSELERSKFDTHADKDQKFSLSLNGNPIYCGCQNIRFLSWLERTHINLDNQRNYSCTLESGITTTTKQIKDLDAMWRKCNGETSLFISLVLCCLMISGFFIFIVIFKFKMQLKAFLLRKFWPPFIMKTPADYAIGVYIGYADRDRHLACHRLRWFIEERLGLSTYVKHRDLIPASDMAEAIAEAVHSSWRVLFLVSDHFLADPWSFFALKTSTYAAQMENPGRIVLVMMDGDDNECLLSKLPTSVLKAVQEQSIVTMTSRGQIPYEDKQALVTALLYRGSFFDD